MSAIRGTHYVVSVNKDAPSWIRAYGFLGPEFSQRRLRQYHVPLKSRPLSAPSTYTRPHSPTFQVCIPVKRIQKPSEPLVPSPKKKTSRPGPGITISRIPARVSPAPTPPPATSSGRSTSGGGALSSSRVLWARLGNEVHCAVDFAVLCSREIITS